MTRSLGGEQSLKAEVFDVGNGTQMGHCTIKGRSDAVKVFGEQPRVPNGQHRLTEGQEIYAPMAGMVIVSE